jgi:dsDNA-specific endonuclease/ATPase MutS2
MDASSNNYFTNLPKFDFGKVLNGFTVEKYKELKKKTRDLENSLKQSKKELAEHEDKMLDNAEELLHQTYGPFTVVVLRLDHKIGYGIAKKSHADENKPLFGYKIALGRAKESLLNKINGTNLDREDILIG